MSCVRRCCAGTVAGVVGVQLTGVILDARGGAENLSGWYLAHLVAAVVCSSAMVVFNTFARGDRVFD